MLFNSFEFLVFFPLVTAAYFLAPHRYRTTLLLFSSCVFYMWFIPSYILVIGTTIVVDYLAAIGMARTKGRSRWWLLVGSIFSTCLILFIFKYFNFFDSSLATAARVFGWNYPKHVLDVMLPVGLSFHTFQSLSYVIEVYRGNQKAERNFLTYSLYVMFFPQMVAGPIERPQNLLHQFKEKHEFKYVNAVEGLRLILWGLIQKIAVADWLAAPANYVFENPRSFDSGLPIIIGTFCFALQIYCDFSGYSNIARGCAQVLGFNLMKNFDQPYMAQNISEFWRRWHISLSTWFKDYLYIPLGGGRVGILRRCLNLLIVFGISGLWHGANWTYVIWGLLNGAYLSVAVVRGRLAERFGIFRRLSFATPTLFKQLTTFTLIGLSWIFFRARTVDDAFYMLTRLTSGWGALVQNLLHKGKGFIFDQTLFGLWFGMGSSELLRYLGLGLIFLTIEYYFWKHPIGEVFNRTNRPVRWTVYTFAAWYLIVFGNFHEERFIYFVF